MVALPGIVVALCQRASFRIKGAAKYSDPFYREWQAASTLGAAAAERPEELDAAGAAYPWLGLIYVCTSFSR